MTKKVNALKISRGGNSVFGVVGDKNKWQIKRQKDRDKKTKWNT